MTTSLAIWEAVAGVPGGRKYSCKDDEDTLETTLTVFVFNYSVKKDARHGYCAAREEWIVVHAVANFDTGRRIDVASEKGEDVVL